MRKSYFLAGLLLLLTASLCALSVRAQEPEAVPATVNSEIPGILLNAFAERLRETYAFPDQAESVVNHMMSRLNEGAYAGITNPTSLATRLTDDVRAFTDDGHFSFRYDPMRFDGIGAMGLGPNPNVGMFEDDDEDDGHAFPAPGTPAYDQILAEFVGNNFNMPHLEVFEGNIGYLRLGIFPPIELARETLDAAMTFLAHVDALIIDVRDVPGGVGGFTPYLSSYFFEESGKLLFSREYAWAGETEEFRATDVGGPKRPVTPLWILTSAGTGSAAENLSYTLQQHGRAVTVGEATVGGAHSSSLVQLVDGFVAQIPIARVVHPVSNGNWEGTGVIPDIDTPAANALTQARMEALSRLISDAMDPGSRTNLERARDRLEAETREMEENVPKVDATLEDYIGTYGIRRVFVEAGGLRYQREGGPPTRLIRKEGDLFEFDLDPNMRAAVVLPDIRFDRDESGRVVRITALSAEGVVQDVFERTE
jgi:hypothetical protein